MNKEGEERVLVFEEVFFFGNRFIPVRSPDPAVEFLRLPSGIASNKRKREETNSSGRRQGNSFNSVYAEIFFRNPSPFTMFLLTSPPYFLNQETNFIV